MISNFSWLLPGRLAGFGLPYAASPQILSALRSEGVDALITLTEASLDEAAVRQAGLRCLHLPIPDMAPPSQEQIEAFAEFVDEAIGQGLGAAVHCRAGLGRTGTMLAAYLIHQGHSCDRAIEQVRCHRPGSVETLEQEQALREFARRRQVQAPSRA